MMFVTILVENQSLLPHGEEQFEEVKITYISPHPTLSLWRGLFFRYGA